MTATAVPKIEIDGRTARSSASIPRHMPDTAACWSDADRRKAKRLMAQTGDVICADATAYAGMLSISLDMLYQNREVKAKLVKQYE